MTTLDDRIRELVAHAYAHAPAIQGIMDEAGVRPEDITSAEDLRKLPITSKDKLVEIHHANPPFGGFLAMDAANLPRIYISPGPIYDPQPPNPEMADEGLSVFRYLGLGRGDRVINTFAYHLTPAGFLLDDGLRAVGATVLPMGPGNTDLQIHTMTALGVTGFAGQPSYLMTILDRCEELGIAKDAVPIKKALFSAEPYTPTQRARFEDEYGMRTTSAYGTADLGFVGYTMAGVEGFRIMGGVHLEIVDPSTGEPMPAGEIGEVVATLFNKAYPLLRFGTGDLGALGAEPLDGGQHLLGLYGRSGDAIKVRGMFLHPNQLRAALTAFPQIARVQAIITRPENKDVVTLRMEMKPGLESEGEAVGQQLQQLAQAAVRLRIDTIEVVAEGGIDPAARTIIDERNWD